MKKSVALLFLACHTPSASPDPTPAPMVSSSAAPLATPTTIGTAPPVEPVATAKAPEYIDDVAAWLKSRHASVPAALANGASCTAQKLGTSDALLCQSNPDSLPSGESVYAISVWIVSNGRADLALSAASAAGPLDREIEPGESSRDDMYIELDVAISGSELTITERPQKTCARVLAQYTSREWDGHRRVVQKACAARGRYVLHDGKLVRAP